MLCLLPQQIESQISNRNFYSCDLRFAICDLRFGIHVLEILHDLGGETEEKAATAEIVQDLQDVDSNITLLVQQMAQLNQTVQILDEEGKFVQNQRTVHVCWTRKVRSNHDVVVEWSSWSRCSGRGRGSGGPHPFHNISMICTKRPSSSF